MRRLNASLDRVGLAITTAVGTMWCAIAFAVVALVSLPGVLSTHNIVNDVSWLAQTFLQLVLLSVIMVGQRLQAAQVEQHAAAHEDRHEAIMSSLDALHDKVENDNQNT